MANVGITSFNGGEASPLIDTRLDIDKYRSLCRVLENMIPSIYGTAIKRPGTRFIYKVTVPTREVVEAEEDGGEGGDE